MWDPPSGYSLIDLTGSSHVVLPQSPLRAPQSPMRIGTKASRSPRPERQRRPAPPVLSKESELSASPKRDQRKMRPLRPSNSGMTAVLTIREHAAVLDQSEASSQMRFHHGGDGADSGEAFESTRGEEIDEHVLAGGLKDAYVREGEIHATMADRYHKRIACSGHHDYRY